MVVYMESHPDLAKGYVNTCNAREKSREQWMELVEELNALGPPTKDAEGWKKVWADYKQNIKKKIRKNSRNMFKTGGGPPKQIVLTETEKRAHDLLNLTDAVLGNKNVRIFGAEHQTTRALAHEVSQSCAELGIAVNDIKRVSLSPESEPAIQEPAVQEPAIQEPPTLADSETPNQIEISEETPGPPAGTTSAPRKRKRRNSEKENALQVQIDVQKNFYTKVLSGINNNIEINSKLFKATEELVGLKEREVKMTEELIELKKEKMRNTEIYRHEKLKFYYEKFKDERRHLMIEEEQLKIKSAKKF